ncbi:MAG TPA: DUF308 domain-containing protein [Candidatus Olsenella pullicola]|nr:DUF308 domain-containing protein [Candidatus Olsenella pullicola]
MERYDSSFDHVGDFVERWNSGVRRARLWMILLAVALILVGMGSAVAPFGLYELIQTLVSVALVVGGVGQVVSYARTPELFRSATMLVMGVLNALLGVLLFVLPAYLTAGTIVFLLAFLFIIAGAERITTARHLRYFGVEGTGLATATGVLNIVAGVVFLLMPAFSSLAFSYVLAAYLVVGGVSLLAEALTMHPIER